MSLLKQSVSMKLLSLASVLSLTAGCATANPERIYINVRPKAEPLSPAVLQAMQPNSTVLLNEADNWYLNSGKLLDSVTDN